MFSSSEKEYERVITLAKPHIANLDFIAKLFTDRPEGGIMYSHLSFDPNQNFVVKQKNLVHLAKKCNKILEIGFNIGHSALLMLLANPLCKIVCMDICSHAYTLPCFKYLCLCFPERLVMLPGDSNRSLENFHCEYFDMAHVDGCHEFSIASKDLYLSCCKVKPQGYVVFDDTDLPPMEHIWNRSLERETVRAIETGGIIPTRYHKIGRVNEPVLKIAVCSLAVGEDYIQKVKYGMQTKKTYCELKNYDYFTDSDVFDKDRPCAWSKIPLIQRYLEKGTGNEKDYDYIVWIDADTHIMNNNTKLEEIIRKYQNNKDILLTRDFESKINSGVMFIKNTAWTREYFTKLYGKTEFLHSANWEQDAMIDMLEKNEFDCQNHMEVLSKEKQHVFNSYHCNYQYNDFIVHLAGCYRYGKNNGLELMMAQFCPVKMEEDSDMGFAQRMHMLRNFRPERELDL